MLGLTIASWPDMAEQLTQEQSRRQMLFEPHKALGNAIAPVVLLIVVAAIALVPDSTRLSRRRSILEGASPADRRRMLNLALILTSLLLIGVHAAVIWTYLGHDVDPAQVTVWSMSGVLGFIGLMAALGAFPSPRPGTGIRLTGAVMVLAAVVGAGLSVDHPLPAIGITSVALAVGVVVLVLIHLRMLTTSGRG